MKPKKLFGMVREISRSLADCELVHLPRGGFDMNRAREQHALYVEALKANGVEALVLPEEPELPDATFVEDTAVILDEIAVICRFGTHSRVPETLRICTHIESARKTRWIHPPGTLEGGDVLRIGKTLYVGISSRTNIPGLSQLETIVREFGYSVVPVQVRGCLHLKTGATAPAKDTVVVNPDWVDANQFAKFKQIRVPPEEPWAANTLTIDGNVFIPASFPRMAGLLTTNGFAVQPVEISEIQKAEAGLTCLSLLFENAPFLKRDLNPKGS